MKILGIETSCDETGIALVEASGGLKSPRLRILKNFVASQIKIHRPFGGVVPNLAKREHLRNLPILLKKLGAKNLKTVGLIAVTVGPGLEPALWTGINFAEDLAKKLKISLFGVNHLEGHLYSFLLPKKTFQPQAISDRSVFPSIALIVSGGHTILLKMDSLVKWKNLGETRDDAVGEAFDKVARLLNLPYPGGPEIEKISRKGDPAAIDFPRPMIHDKSYAFSFSGLKTSVLYFLRDLPAGRQAIPQVKADVAASFQEAAVDVLTTKTLRAAKAFSAKSILLSGGVAANKILRKRLEKISNDNDLKFLAADFEYNLDNAAMIAAAGYLTHLKKKKYPLRANGNLNI